MRIYVILILGVFLMLSACETEREFKLPSQEKLVLLSDFSPNKSFELSLSVAKSFTDTTQTPFIYPRNADIFLYEEDRFLGEFQYKESVVGGTMNYKLDILPKSGLNYSIQANYSNFPDVFAMTTVPSLINAELLAVNDLNGSNDLLIIEDSVLIIEDSVIAGGILVDTELKFSSFGKKYLHLKCWSQSLTTHLNDTLLREMHPLQVVNTIKSTELVHEVGTLVEYQPSATASNYLQCIIPSMLSSTSNISLRHFFLEIRLVNLDYYLFHQSLSNRNPFSSQQRPVFDNPPPLIYSNIEGGLGNFSAYTNIVLDFKR